MNDTNHNVASQFIFIRYDMPGRSSTGSPVRQGFTGYWRDGESGLGLYYAGARMYSPGTGRFFGADPLAEDFATWSPYVYVFNNPVSLIDPLGLCPTGSRVGDTFDGSTCITQSLPEITVTASRESNISLASSVVTGFVIDVTTPEASDVLVWKWVGWAGAYIAARMLDELLPNTQVIYNQDKKLSDWEIGKLEEKLRDAEWSDIHVGKGNKSTGSKDYYKRPDGEIVIKPKGGSGPGEPIGINIRDL